MCQSDTLALGSTFPTACAWERNAVGKLRGKTRGHHRCFDPARGDCVTLLPHALGRVQSTTFGRDWEAVLPQDPCLAPLEDPRALSSHRPVRERPGPNDWPFRPLAGRSPVKVESGTCPQLTRGLLQAGGPAPRRPITHPQPALQLSSSTSAESCGRSSVALLPGKFRRSVASVPEAKRKLRVVNRNPEVPQMSSPFRKCDFAGVRSGSHRVCAWKPAVESLVGRRVP